MEHLPINNACRIVSFTKRPSLALCAASPAMRLATVQHSDKGYTCDKYRISTVPSSQGTLFQVTEASSPLAGLCVSSNAAGWWLLRTRVPFRLELEQCIDLSTSPLTEPLLPLLRGLHLARNSVLEPFTWISLCSQLESLSMLASTVGSIEWVVLACPTLRTLNLNGCNLIADIPVIGRLGHLRHLNVSSTRIDDGLVWISGCPLLEKLVVSGCKSSDGGPLDLTTIATLPCLLELDMSGTRIESLAWIPRVCSLEKLNIALCRDLVDFDPIAGIEYLQTLSLSHTNVESMECVRNCLSLEILDISYCQQITDFSAIGSLENLKSLDMSDDNGVDMQLPLSASGRHDGLQAEC